MILFSRQELPFSGEKGKKFGMTQAFFTSFQLSASCCVRTTSASSFFTASSCFFFQCRAICLYGNPRCSIRCRLRVYGLAIWDSPIFTLPSSSCVRKSNSRPNVLMTTSEYTYHSEHHLYWYTNNQLLWGSPCNSGRQTDLAKRIRQTGWRMEYRAETPPRLDTGYIWWRILQGGKIRIRMSWFHNQPNFWLFWVYHHWWLLSG